MLYNFIQKFYWICIIISSLTYYPHMHFSLSPNVLPPFFPFASHLKPHKVTDRSTL